jgi:hypothetical protein
MIHGYPDANPATLSAHVVTLAQRVMALEAEVEALKKLALAPPPERKKWSPLEWLRGWP